MQKSCQTIENYAIAPTEVGAEQLLVDPSVVAEVKERVDSVLIPTERVTMPPQPDVTAFTKEVDKLVSDVGGYRLDEELISSFENVSALGAEAVANGVAAERLLERSGLGCIACGAMNICPIAARLHEVSEEATATKQSLTDIRAKLDEVEANITAKIIKQGFTLPSGDRMANFLQTNGFLRVRQTGSHMILKKENDEGGELSVPVPIHKGKDLPLGTFLSILRMAKIPLKHFVEGTK